jgi:hypothetical protein
MDEQVPILQSAMPDRKQQATGNKVRSESGLVACCLSLTLDLRKATPIEP